MSLLSRVSTNRPHRVRCHDTRKLERVLSVLLVFWFFCLPAEAKYGGGMGTAEDPYLIYTAEQINAIGADANDWDKHFKLMADIDLGGFSGNGFNIIGTSLQNYFGGVFDGNGHKIANFTYISTGTEYVGIFGTMGGHGTYAAVIKNLTVVDPKVDAQSSQCVGSLVGFMNQGTVIGCGSEGGSVSGSSTAGGLVGYKNSGIISKCYSTCDVSGGSLVGGLVGHNGGQTTSECYAAGNVQGSFEVGGLAGVSGGKLENCYATGSVAGTEGGVGGLVGWNFSFDGQAVIYHCYSTGCVTGEGESVGGLVGRRFGANSEAIESFWDVQTSGRTISDGGTGKTTPEMQMADTFVEWGYDPVWTIDGGSDYPRLWWEDKPGEIIIAPFLELASVSGTGKKDDPFLIYTPEQLNSIGLYSSVWNKHFKLMANIDLSDHMGLTFNVVGFYNNNNDRKPFTGVFDGNGHTISNFTYISNYANNIGMFGYVDGPDTEIRNLGLLDPNVNVGTGADIGALVGRFYQGTITGCYVEGGSVSGTDVVGGLVGLFGCGYGCQTIADCRSTANVSATGHDVGGLVGLIGGSLPEKPGTTMVNCYAAGDISGAGAVGGLVGNAYDVEIIDCHASSSVTGDCVGGLVGGSVDVDIINCGATGTVAGTKCAGGLIGGANGGRVANCYAAGSVVGADHVGGLVGQCSLWAVIISNCYVTGDVMGDSYVGGLVGGHEIGRVTILNCYSACSVTGTANTGGLVGFRSSGMVVSSFWDIQTSGQLSSSGGTGKTTEQMQIASTFVGWGCDPVWTLDEGNDYPRLRWEEVPGDVITTPSFGTMLGSGTPSDPYLIYTAEELNMIGLFPCEWSKHFKLVADIDLASHKGTAFNVIGNEWFQFSGTFDGSGHAISNFNYASQRRRCAGLFGVVDGENAQIRSLGLIDPNVTGMGFGYAGSLVGDLRSGSVTECYAQGGSILGDDSVGGLVGRCVDGAITNCHCTSAVSGVSAVGGLVGSSHSGKITACYATGGVSGGTKVGGLVGEKEGGTVWNCYASGNVSATYASAGGLVGSNSGGIKDCYSAGLVAGVKDVGGLAGGGGVGWWYWDTRSFWDIQTSGQTTSAAGTGKTTGEMQMESTYRDAGWDFVGEWRNGTQDIWCICEGQQYPRLAWQFVAGDFDGDGDTDFADFCILAQRWLQTDSSFWCGGGGTDLTNDGNVDFADFKELMDNWLWEIP